MWGSIINLIGGSLLGVVGGWVTKWMDLKAEEKKQAHEIAKIQAEAQVMAQEWAARTKVAEVEAAGKVEAADSAAFGQAVAAEAVRYSQGVQATKGQGWALVLLDVLRGAVRPCLTIYLIFLVTMLWNKAADLVPAQADPIWAQNMVQEISMKILWLADVSVAFWFGTRSRAK